MDTPVTGAVGHTLLGLSWGVGLGSVLANVGVIGADVAGSASIAFGLLANFVLVTFLK